MTQYPHKAFNKKYKDDLTFDQKGNNNFKKSKTFKDRE